MAIQRVQACCTRERTKNGARFAATVPDDSHTGTAEAAEVAALWAHKAAGATHGTVGFR